MGPPTFMRPVVDRNVVLRHMYVISQRRNTNGFCNDLICFVRVAVISIKHTHRLRIACSKSQCVSIDRLLDGTATTMARRRNNSKFVRAELVTGEGRGRCLGNTLRCFVTSRYSRDERGLHKLQELELELRSVGIATHPTVK